MESMECTGPSTVVIEELSDEEWDGLLVIEGPSDNKGVFVKEEVTVMCSNDGFHQEEVAGTNVAEVEDVQVVEQVNEQGVQVDEQVDEGEHSDTFFDVPVDFERNQEGSDEEDPEEDSDFVESDYRSDKDNPNFAKYDVI
ncbi:hypothetical protein D8674_008406 [Pyrus ussuriensis x Pyrus communis]|uniref:Uncharacterized protein n=1 Tax=Pyrus ussuriensis x Pyrus communis TaxID=2448454 RepID=A0A5N5HVL6_9ROSA|nr:hypothetical protein D8674_008406 [Pyrus ussuriensis x Pyrus communis]